MAAGFPVPVGKRLRSSHVSCSCIKNRRGAWPLRAYFMLWGAILMSLIHISHLNFTYEGSCDLSLRMSVQLDTN